MRRLLAVLAVLGVAACGQNDRPLADAQDGLGEVRSGVLHLALTGGSGAQSGDGVGFALDGPFDMSGQAGQLPTAELTFTRVGAKAQKAVFVSDGTQARVTTGGRTTQLRGTDLDQLRLTDDTEGVAGLHLSDWADGKATRTEDGDVTRIAADVDPVKALNDVFGLAGQFDPDGAVRPIEGKTAERLRAAVSSSKVVVEQGSDGLVRSLRLDVAFKANADAALRDALGDYAAAWLRLDLRIDDPKPAR